MQPGPPLFLPMGDAALLVDFGAPSPAVSCLDAALAAQPCAGFVEAVPALASLAVVFDPLLTDHAAVEAHLRAIARAGGAVPPPGVLRRVEVCYAPEVAPDLAAVAAACGIGVEAVIAAHLAGRYRVGMYGFAPGYAYLTGVPDLLRLDRKPAAVRGVAAGSVIIAGGQCLVTTLRMPTGWWVIGRSPTRVLTGDAARPFLFDVGDRVEFRRVGLDALAGGADGA